MGLDSVELIIAFEKYFKVNIPDREAEKIYRIIDVVRYLDATCNTTASKAEPVLSMIQNKFKDLFNLAPEDPIFKRYSVADKMFWRQAEVTTDLKIMLPDGKDPGNLNLMQRLFYLKPGYEVAQITYGRFLEILAYVNYKTLIEPGKCNTIEALTIAVCGITIELNGLDPYEVYPSSSFVDDLGIN